MSDRSQFDDGQARIIETLIDSGRTYPGEQVTFKFLFFFETQSLGVLAQFAKPYFVPKTFLGTLQSPLS